MKRITKKQLMILLSLVSAGIFMASAGVLAATFVSATTEKITVEVGENPMPEKIHSSSFLSSLYSVEPYSIDVSEPGEHSIDLRFFGFIPGEVTVEVCDTTPPVLVLTDIKTVEGTEVTVDDFIVSCTDATDVAISSIPKNITAEAGEFTVEITATDSAGNMTSENASLSVWDSSHVLAAELNAADLERTIREKHPEVTEMDLSDISTGVIGEYILHASSESASYIWPVKVSDTTPPTVDVKNLVVRTGTVPSPEEYILSVNDVSGYTVSFGRETDVSKEGLHTVRIRVEDIYGNVTEKSAKLLSAVIPERINFEYGVNAEEIRRAILEGTKQKHRFTLSECPVAVGEYGIEVQSSYGNYTVSMMIADTTPPELELTDITVYKGDPVEIDSFIEKASDLSKVSWKYTGSEPSTKSVGRFDVSITASDVYGNKTEKRTTLHVIGDTTPPVIYGIADKYILAGDTVSFKKGVYAVDDRDGDVSFKVDSSAVNTAAAGKYPVIYTSSDSSGNEAKVTSYITVTLISMDSVNELADSVLAGIITTKMTEREKAWAIYEWITSSLRYSTRTSYLMGNYVEGAYSGFTIRSGNCYIYYAVSGVLLTRAGIENIMIQRNKPDDPHYWNMIKIDGEWYHFDTCPHFPGHEKQCFMWTDADLENYNKNEVADYYSFDKSLYPATP